MHVAQILWMQLVTTYDVDWASRRSDMSGDRETPCNPPPAGADLGGKRPPEKPFMNPENGDVAILESFPLSLSMARMSSSELLLERESCGGVGKPAVNALFNMGPMGENSAAKVPPGVSNIPKLP
jgi:hypothetical protein